MNNDWFRHDYNAHEDIKQKRLLKAKGLPALGLYWYLVECLYQNNGQMSDKDIRLEAELMDGAEYLDDLAEFELFSFNKGIWSCKRVTDELKFKEERKQKKSEAGKKGMASRWGDNSGKTESENDITADNSVITKNNKPQKSITDDNTLTNTITKNNKYIVSSDEDTRPNGNEETDSDSPLFVKKTKDDTPYSEIVQYWNERAAKNGLSQCMKITDERKWHICNRWREYHEDVYTAIDKIMASDFCKEGNWCGFDWVLKPSNMVKVLEGKYDNKNGFSKNRKAFNPTDLNGRYSEYKAKKVQI